MVQNLILPIGFATDPRPFIRGPNVHPGSDARTIHNTEKRRTFNRLEAVVPPFYESNSIDDAEGNEHPEEDDGPHEHVHGGENR